MGIAISVIIPTLNESEHIASLVSFLFENAGKKKVEVIVVDGGSTDNTVALSAGANARVVKSPGTGRALQMNYGSSLATGDILYFVHADTIPPATYAADICKMVLRGYELGRYRTRFNSNNLLLRLNAFFTRFDWFVCYGGDQTLFITRKLFHSVRGYDEDLRLMEEYDLVKRARTSAWYKIMDGEVLVSARKYRDNSWWAVQRANYTMVQMYKRGAAQDEMVREYHALLKYR